jgi:lipopolysaccharide transport system ATP-binding protein
MSDVVIKVEGLGKRYVIGHQQERGQATLREVLSDGARRAGRRLLHPLNSLATQNGGREEFWALKDVSFGIKQGEVVGIVGRNGAGKSTLLKILSRITEPTTGRVRIKGRLASLLEVGTGFHPQLTGRENIFLNGAILGMSRAEIRRKFDEIVAFAAVEKFLDTPVKHYSSGMYVRLAFAVAAHLEPELLIIDEVLAVGDAEFQKKCLGKMGAVAKDGRTVLFVSHNMGAVEALCTSAVYLDRGQVVKTGQVDEVIREYLNLARKTDSRPEIADYRREAFITRPWIKEVSILSERDEPTGVFRIGEGLRIKLRLKGDGRLSNPRIGIGVNDDLGRRVFTLGTEFDPALQLHIEDNAVLLCKIPELLLMPGQYSLTIALSSANELIDQIDGLFGFDVTESDFFKTGKLQRRNQGFFVCRSHWDLLSDDDRTAVRA